MDAAAIATQKEALTAQDYAALGFMCGLEIHQQLDTRKLFSPCPSDVVDPDNALARTVAVYDRRLRATQSELGESDPAAVAEAKKRKAFRYLAIDGLTSLVELDEEPPHPMSDDALDVALTFAGLLGSRPADEVHIMRKTVIDGSNTSGFQRTALVATGGRVDPAAGDVGIWTIAVEEDSARKLDTQGGRTRFTLDRLGVPLIEVATSPDIKDPKHAQETAARLGALLRATGRVRRGLGSIRQDLNVSVGVGDRVEIKGCQDLRAVPRIIEAEVRRQLWMHHVAEQLKERGFTPAEVGSEAVDVTDAFAKTGNKRVAAAIKKGHRVLGLRLPRFGGLLAAADEGGPRMGRELADHAKVAAGVGGIFHSDELLGPEPKYGFTQEEVTAAREALGIVHRDGFVLCVEADAVARQALDAVAQRARDALTPAREVRAAQPDDSTRFMRPLPGAARMYPETDVPPIRIEPDRWTRILGGLPAKPEERIADLVKGGLSEDQATQLVQSGDDDRFRMLTTTGVEAALAARILLQMMPEWRSPRTITLVPAVADALAAGRFAKEAVPDVLKALDDGAVDVDAAIQKAGVGAVDASEVDAVIADVLASRQEFVMERGMAAMGPLMGPVMAELRGKADGAVISARLRHALQEMLAGATQG